MSFKRIFVACLAATIVLSTPVSVFADEVEASKMESHEENITIPDEPNDINLIVSYGLSCYSSSNSIYVTSFTVGNKILSEIGIINIQVQRSANGVNGWATCKPQFDLTETNSSACYVNDYQIPVTSGYYYRIVVTHYTKEQGWWFPRSQSVSQTSGIMKIN